MDYGYDNYISSSSCLLGATVLQIAMFEQATAQVCFSLMF